jgi:hypothetical protein
MSTGIVCVLNLVYWPVMSLSASTMNGTLPCCLILSQYSIYSASNLHDGHFSQDAFKLQ